ncbi:MAG: DNA internalization-related competence protein ComEC/Rec2 [Methylophilus sp.]
MVALALGFVLGAWWLQQQIQLPNVSWLIFSSIIVCLLFGVFVRYISHKVLVKNIILFVSALFLGFTWAALVAHSRLSDELPKAWEQENITLIGVIASLPEVTEYGERFEFNVEKVLTPEAKVPAHISLRYYQQSMFSAVKSKVKENFHAGERWQLTVRLKRPHATYNPHGVDYEALALSENIRAIGNIRKKSTNRKLDSLVWQPKYLITHVRELVGRHINQSLKDKAYAGVIRGLVIGDGSQISAQNWDVYLRTGTNHLMSISGLHITMLSGLVFALVNMLWRRFPSLVMRLATQKAACVAGMLTALIYAALAGFSVPTQRTLYMLMTVALMLLVGRKIAFPNILSVALLVVVLIDPWAVSAPGFWLSFGAVAVMVYAASRRLATEHWLVEATKAQWAVTIGLLPALVLMFGQISLISPIANAIAIPVVSFIVVPFAILGSVLPVDSILYLSHQVLYGCMLILNWLAQLPIAIWQQGASTVWAALIGVIGVVVLLLPRGVPLRYFGLFCFLPMMFVEPERPAKGDMQVTVLDVGQGLSVVVKTSKHTMLYDAGAKYNAQTDAGSGIVVPYLRTSGVKHLEGVVVSHDDIDHAGGIPSVLAQMSVDWMISPLSPTATMFNSPQYLKFPPKKHDKCYAGQHWQWDGVKFEVIYPEAKSYENENIKDNDRSCVIRVSSANGSILLSGDVEKGGEYEMLENHADLLKTDVLIAPHHGSKTSSTQDFIQAVSPKFVVFTNGYLNRFGHPKAVVVQRYVNQDAQVLRSDYDGAVQLDFTKKQAVKVLKWRKVERRYWHDQYP